MAWVPSRSVMGRVFSICRHITAVSLRNLALSLDAESSPLKALSSAVWASRAGMWDLLSRSFSERLVKASRSLAGNPDSPQAGVFLTSIIDEIVGVETYYVHYYAI